MEQIKPCPFCGSENLSVGSFGNYIKCKNCGTAGPDGSTLNEAFDKWNAAPRKEDVEMEEHYGSRLNCKYNPCTTKTPGTLWCSNREEKEDMEKNCANCKHISEEVDGKVYCSETVNEIYGCNYYEPKNPFAYDFRICRHCKHSYGYQVAGTDTIVLRCGRNIGSSKEYVCDKWEAKELEPDPLNPENSSVKPFIDLARDELYVIRTLETKVNEYQMAAEEAAELAQALLKLCRVEGHGSYTPVNPKDAEDAVIEEYADLLLAMEASFPRCEGNKMFYNNLGRVYKKKSKRWAERLKNHDD